MESKMERAMTEHPTVLFDGECNLCNGLVQFIIRRDPNGTFRFAALQSEAGRRLLGAVDFTTVSTDVNPSAAATDYDTFVYVENERVFMKSTAALRIARRLGMPWTLLYPLIVVPRPIRDMVYSWVARNRYRWFGKKDQCMIPTPDIRARFIDD